MADSLLGPALSLPSLLSTAALLGPEDEEDGLEVDFTPRARRANLNEDEEEDVFGDDDPPSMTLREILLNADTGHLDLLGLPQIFFTTPRFIFFLIMRI
jgi:hypothetical protein